MYSGIAKLKKKIGNLKVGDLQYSPNSLVSLVLYGNIPLLRIVLLFDQILILRV